MPQKKQTANEQLKTLKRRLSTPLPSEIKKNSGGTGGIILDTKDERTLDKAWKSLSKRNKPKTKTGSK